MKEEQERQSEEGPQGRTGGKRSRAQAILIAGLVILLAAVAVLGYMILHNWGDRGPAGTSNLVVDETSKDVNLAEKVQDGMYAVKMNASWQFPDGKSASTDAYVANSENNKRDVYFEVSLRDTEELVYTSPVIPVGSAIQGFALDKALDQGNYPAYCTYHLLDENGETASSLSIEITISILN